MQGPEILRLTPFAASTFGTAVFERVLQRTKTQSQTPSPVDYTVEMVGGCRILTSSGSLAKCQSNQLVRQLGRPATLRGTRGAHILSICVLRKPEQINMRGTCLEERGKNVDGKLSRLGSENKGSVNHLGEALVLKAQGKACTRLKLFTTV